MRIIIRKFLIVSFTIIISLCSSLILIKLYRSQYALDKSNWTCYYNDQFNFNITSPKSSSVLKKGLEDDYILQKISIPINSSGLLNSISTNFCINVISKENFKQYFSNKRYVKYKENINSCGEKYVYAISFDTCNSYFFKYNDYVFEIQEPKLGYSFEDNKINEIFKTILIPSFKRFPQKQ